MSRRNICFKVDKVHALLVWISQELIQLNLQGHFSNREELKNVTVASIAGISSKQIEEVRTRYKDPDSMVVGQIIGHDSSTLDLRVEKNTLLSLLDLVERAGNI